MNAIMNELAKLEQEIIELEQLLDDNVKINNKTVDKEKIVSIKNIISSLS